MRTATLERQTSVVSNDHPDVRRHLQRIAEIDHRIATSDALILSVEAEIPQEEERIQQFNVAQALGRSMRRRTPEPGRLQVLRKQLEQARIDRTALVGAKAQLEAETEKVRARAAVQVQALADVRRILGEQLPLVEQLEALQRDLLATSQRHNLPIGGELALLFFNVANWKNAALRAAH